MLLLVSKLAPGGASLRTTLERIYCRSTSAAALALPGASLQEPQEICRSLPPVPCLKVHSEAKLCLGHTGVHPEVQDMLKQDAACVGSANLWRPEESMQHKLRQAVCMQKPLEVVWVCLKFGWGVVNEWH